jgi:hypothetical protein
MLGFYTAVCQQPLRVYEHNSCWSAYMYYNESHSVMFTEVLFEPSRDSIYRGADIMATVVQTASCMQLHDATTS